MARRRRYAGPGSRWNTGIFRWCLSLKGSGALAGVHVPLKFVRQLRGPLGGIPKGSSCRIIYEGILVAIRMPGPVSRMKLFVGMPMHQIVPGESIDELVSRSCEVR